MLPYLLITITLIGNVIGLMLVKKTVVDAGAAPQGTADIVPYLFKIILNPLTWLAVLAVFIGLLAFWLTLSRMEISRIYPIIGGLSYVLVAVFSILLFKENVTLWGWMGIVMISAGVILLFRA